MKKLIFCILLFCQAARVFGQTAMTFEQFKRLSPAQRDEVTATANADDTNPARWKIINWWWRLHIGEEAWLRKQQVRLISEKNIDSLDNLFITYQGLRESCLRQEWERENAQTLSKQEQFSLGMRYGEIEKQDANIRGNMVSVLASLKPCPELDALNSKAQQLADEIYVKYPNYRISREQMTVVDLRMRELTNEVQNLPKLAPSQIQAALDALPPDQSLPRGMAVPSR